MRLYYLFLIVFLPTVFVWSIIRKLEMSLKLFRIKTIHTFYLNWEIVESFVIEFSMRGGERVISL